MEPVCVCGHTQDEHAPFSGACDAGACGCLCFDEAPEDGADDETGGGDL